jgi:2-iminobutanoate/2-iminopropanoate deaminase
MKKEIVLVKEAPAPIGPYSQAVKAGSFLFCSGMIPLDPVSGQVVGADVKTQAAQVMKNIEALLNGAGVKFSDVVKTTIFLKSMNDFPQVNEIYGTYFKENPPARSTVEVARLPKDVLVEVEITAFVG